MKREIKDDVKINKFRLDDECQEHASLYYYYAEQLADAKKERDTAKANFKETTARTELNYRADRPGYELDCKKTESSISAAVEIHKDVIAAKQDYLRAEALVNKTESAAESMRQRKGMLDNLISLYQTQYYSEPHGKSKTDQTSDDHRKSLNKRS